MAVYYSPPATERFGDNPVLRILVIDGDQDTAESTAMLLRLWGHAVEVALSGVQALQLATAAPPDVVLSEVVLPRLDGLQLAAQLRRLSPATLLIALTTLGQQEDRRRSREAGFHLHLVKPVDLDWLEQTLQAVAFERAGGVAVTK